MFAILYNCGKYQKLAHYNGRIHLFDTEYRARRFINRDWFYSSLPRVKDGYQESVRIVKYIHNN